MLNSWKSYLFAHFTKLHKIGRGLKKLILHLKSAKS